jgi:hypothetical protein
MNQNRTKKTAPGMWPRVFERIGRLRARIGPASYFYSTPRFVWRIAEHGETAFYVWLGRRQVIRLVVLMLVIGGGIWLSSRNPGP